MNTPDTARTNNGRIKLPKTREEIEKLKKDWASDPIWDLEDTEGFEAHRDELKEFSDFKNRHWEACAAARLKTQLTALSNRLGVPLLHDQGGSRSLRRRNAPPAGNRGAAEGSAAQPDNLPKP